MMGVPNEPVTWDRSTLAVANGNLVEVDTLVAFPQVRLVFMNLRDDGDHQLPNQLVSLYDNGIASTPTLVPTGTPIQSSYSYTRAAFVQSLIDLLNQFHPSVVRTLDPQPYKAGTFNPDCTGLTTNQCCSIQPPPDYVGFDNTDHTFAARFVDEALKAYNGATGHRHTSILYYIGYSIAQHLGNLGPVEYTDKRSIVDAYKQWDLNLQQTEDCYLGWFGGVYNRYPNNTTWLTKQTNGRLAAFAVENSRVVMWQQKTIGGAWQGPSGLGGTPVAQHLA